MEDASIVTVQRQRSLLFIVFSTLFLLALLISGFFLPADKLVIQLAEKNSPPSLEYWFGTDWLGRDMFARTLKGLIISFAVGLFGAVSSAVLALLFSFLASVSKVLDYIVTWLIDFILSVPHIVLLLLISFVFGGGVKGLVIGIALTHWPSLARLLRAEILQIQAMTYVKISKQIGHSRAWITRKHFFPHILPQLMIGFILLFPHIILHEAALTFLGFGLSQEQPAIGIILSESMRYLSSGMWWLALFPGFCLLLMVSIFDLLGQNLRKFFDPFQAQKG